MATKSTKGAEFLHTETSEFTEQKESLCVLCDLGVKTVWSVLLFLRRLSSR